MADQSLPNDILQFIFIQLPPIRFILRRVQKINSYWKKWAVCAMRAFELHPRDNYKLRLKEVYKTFAENNSTVFPNVTELTINFEAKQFPQSIAKFPKLEKLTLYKFKSDVWMVFNDVMMSQIPPYIKQLIVYGNIVVEPINNPPRFSQLEIYRGVMEPHVLANLPPSLRQLYITNSGTWPSMNPVALDLTKFTGLEVLHVDDPRPITSYLQMKSTTLRELYMSYFREEHAEYFSQKNFPALKRLELQGEDLTTSQLAEFKDMEIVDRTDGYYVPYDERFLKNNRNLVRLRMGTSRHMSDLNYMKNLKELILAREEISPTVMKRVLAIKTLEKLELSGKFGEETTSEEFEPNYGIKILTLRHAQSTSVFFRLWAHLFRGLIKAKIEDDSNNRQSVYATHMKEWTKLEKFSLPSYYRHSNIGKWYFFPVFANLRKFNADVCVDESIFTTLAQCPNLETVEGFELDAGSTSSFLVENLIYGFLKAAKSLYFLSFNSKTPFKLVHERVESFVMPEACINIHYDNARCHARLYTRNADDDF